MNIAIFGSKHHLIIPALIEQLIKHFQGKNYFFSFEKSFHTHILQQGITAAEKFPNFERGDFSADLVMSFGGDGTFLKTASRTADKQIPIVGINTGRLGFLTDFSENEIEHLFYLVETQGFEIDKRSLLKVETSENGSVFEFPCALNEVAIMKQDSSAMICIDAAFNATPVNTYRADGLIVSTPTGSTAYSMSAGGSLVVPQAKNFILSPIASHSLNIRPLIIPDDWTVDLTISSRSNSYLVALDGRSQMLDSTVSLHISKANYSVLIAKQPGHTFFNTLKTKLMWGVDTRN